MFLHFKPVVATFGIHVIVQRVRRKGGARAEKEMGRSEMGRGEEALIF